MNSSVFKQGTNIWMAIRWMDVDTYSKTVWDTTYYAFAKLWTTISADTWNLMKLTDDWTTMRKSYPLSPEWFNDFDMSTRTSERFNNFDPSDPNTFTKKELIFSADYQYKANWLENLYYSDIMDTIITSYADLFWYEVAIRSMARYMERMGTPTLRRKQIIQ